jgi:hypothetical protein
MRARAAQAVDEIGELLAERRRRGGLPVGAREHGAAGVPVRRLAQRGDQRVELGQHDAPARVLGHQRVGEVVDVFRGRGEMDEFERSLHLTAAGGNAAELRAQPVLDRLDVVIGFSFDRLYCF